MLYLSMFMYNSSLIIGILEKLSNNLLTIIVHRILHEHIRNLVLYRIVNYMYYELPNINYKGLLLSLLHPQWHCFDYGVL